MRDRPSPARRFLETLEPGDLVLLAARPGQGKTLMGLRLLIEALEAGRAGVFFTLEYTARDVAERLRSMGLDRAPAARRLVVDTSDTISAAHVVTSLEAMPQGTVAVVDYLQLLDRRRDTPPLAEQLRMLEAFARHGGAIVVLLSQIDRSYDPARAAVPGIGDVRLADPVDLSLFSKSCFLNAGKARFAARAG